MNIQEAMTGALTANIVLFALLLGAQVALRSSTHGLRFALSSLDRVVQASTLEARLGRVKNNQLEFLVLLTPIVMIAVSNDMTIQHTHLISIGVVVGRLTYILVALAGIPILRSACWLIGFVAWLYVLLQVAPYG